MKFPRIATERGVIAAFSIDDLVHWRIIIWNTAALDIDVLYVSYLGTLHSGVEVEMALREWLRKQSPIYSVVGICWSLQEGTDVWRYWGVMLEVATLPVANRIVWRPIVTVHSVDNVRRYRCVLCIVNNALRCSDTASWHSCTATALCLCLRLPVSVSVAVCLCQCLRLC